MTNTTEYNDQWKVSSATKTAPSGITLYFEFYDDFTVLSKSDLQAMLKALEAAEKMT